MDGPDFPSVGLGRYTQADDNAGAVTEAAGAVPHRCSVLWLVTLPLAGWPSQPAGKSAWARLMAAARPNCALDGVGWAVTGELPVPDGELLVGEPPFVVDFDEVERVADPWCGLLLHAATVAPAASTAVKPVRNVRSGCVIGPL